MCRQRFGFEGPKSIINSLQYDIAGCSYDVEDCKQTHHQRHRGPGRRRRRLRTSYIHQHRRPFAWHCSAAARGSVVRWNESPRWGASSLGRWDCEVIRSHWGGHLCVEAADVTLTCLMFGAWMNVKTVFDDIVIRMVATLRDRHAGGVSVNGLHAAPAMKWYFS